MDCDEPITGGGAIVLVVGAIYGICIGFLAGYFVKSWLG